MAATDTDPLDPTVARHRRLCEAFERLGELSASEREAELAGWRERDPGLWHELQAMWEASRSDRLQPRAPAPAPLPEGLGAERGWRVLREIGRGGMGRVLLAERADGRFTRQVAIKVLDGSLHDAEWRRRFLAEREILGRLEHPHIARLLDAGEAADGTPYLVMEFVDGVPLDAWVAREHPGLAARLRLFELVAGAVAHAHQALVAHRDLKPANVLVDAVGSPHLLDFGIARWLSEGQATVTGLRALTPRYAAPEQVEGLPTNAAVDLYQLGVLLYQLLTGAPPFAESSGAALLRAILHDDPPPPSRAARAAGQPHARQVDAELDAICLKALRKRPEERYRSVEALLEDLARWRGGEPVHAMRGGRLYHARKFARRHWGALAATTLVAALTAGFIWRLDAELSRTERARATAELERAAAERERSVAEKVTDLMIQVIGQADPSRAQGQELTLREALDQSVERLRAANDVGPEVRGRLLQSVGATYLSLSQNTQAVALLGESVQAFRAAGDRDGEESAQHAQAVALGNLGRHAEAQGLVETLLAQRAARGVGGDALQSELHSYLAILHRYQGRLPQALPEFRRAVEILRAIPAPETTDREQLAHALRVYGDALGDGGDDVAALAALDESWRLAQQLWPADHPDTIRGLRSLGRNAQRRGDHDAALRHFEDGWARAQRVFEAPDVVRTLLAHSLAQVRLHRGEHAVARELLQGALAEAEQLYPALHSNPATLRTELARALLLAGRDADARAPAQAALAARRELGAPDPLQAEAELMLAVIDCRARVADAAARVAPALQRVTADPRLAEWSRADLERVAALCPGAAK
jgi:tetratricopeptide (TPR) repeat protein/predicted Ser/Thr protein kinase